MRCSTASSYAPSPTGQPQQAKLVVGLRCRSSSSSSSSRAQAVRVSASSSSSASRSFGQGWKKHGQPADDKDENKKRAAQTTQLSSVGSSASPATPVQYSPVQPQQPPLTIRLVVDDGSLMKGFGAPAEQESHGSTLGSTALLRDLISSSAAPSSPLPQRYIGPVKLQSVPGKGRGMLATRDIAAGELLVVSKPLYACTSSVGASLLEDSIHQRIAFTRMTKSDMQLLEAMYDGTEHSTAALPELHTLPASEPRKECLMASWVCAQPTTPPQLHSIIKALLNAADVSLRVTEKGPDTLSMQLEGLIPAQYTLLRNGVPGELILAAARCIDAYAKDPAFRLRLANLGAKRTLNGWVLGDPLLSKMKPGENPDERLRTLDAVMSYINHSCTPNICLELFNGLCIARAARDIACGEEITTNYIDISLPLQQRHKKLHHFGFTCQCSRCVAEEQLGDEAKSAIQEAAQFAPNRDRSMDQETSDFHKMEPACERLLKVMQARAPEQALLITASTLQVLKRHYVFSLYGAGVWHVGVLRTYLRTAHSLAPTSWERVLAAVEFYNRAVQFQEQKHNSFFVKEARQALQDALEWRYGKGHDAAFTARLFDTAIATATQFISG